jgi:hypothetical protein
MSLGTAERQLLAEMPLHAITSVHGQDGLAERLAVEIAAFPPAGQQQVEQALALAARLHAADRRQREPYLNHYADLGIMPSWLEEPLVAAVRVAYRSA